MEEARLDDAARSKPMPLSHHIGPRADPLLFKIIKEHGKNCVTWTGPKPTVIINDPKLVREILSNKHFKTVQLDRRILKLLANGLTVHEGEKWATHRRVIQSAFHLDKLKEMLPAFAVCCSELISRWENYVMSDGVKEIDALPEFQNLTGDVISRAAFDSSFSEGRRIFQIQSEQAKLANQMLFNAYIPGFSFLPTELNRRIKANAREVDGLVRGIITKKERAMKEGRGKNDDLLGFLMESNIAGTRDGGSMTVEDIIGELKLFYFAGMETTAVLLTWTMIILSMHPEWQDKARKEVLRVFGKCKPDFVGINQLKVVTMILHEVLRLYPPIIRNKRQTDKEVEVGGVTYPPGVIFEVPVLFIHRDPDIWGEDAGEFNPERFAEGISKASKDSPAFFPFGWGPRVCIGSNFALLEAKMALSMILQHFSFELSPSYAHAPFPVSTLQPEYGAQIIIKKLSSN